MYTQRGVWERMYFCTYASRISRTCQKSYGLMALESVISLLTKLVNNREHISTIRTLSHKKKKMLNLTTDNDPNPIRR